MGKKRKRSRKKNDNFNNGKEDKNAKTNNKESVKKEDNIVSKEINGKDNKSELKSIKKNEKDINDESSVAKRVELVNDENNVNLKNVEKVVFNDESNNYKKYYLVICFMFLFVVVFVLLMIPRISLFGDKEIVISYKDKYVEPGYRGYSFNEDITDLIKISGGVTEGVVGEYDIKYSVKKYGVSVEKYRKVLVVDKDKPEITVDSNILEVCPNKEIGDFKYMAIDEYDGDITSKIVKKINDNEVVLEVFDSSNNFDSLIVKVDRKDTIKPSISLNGNSVIYLNYGSRYVEPGYVANDNCSGDITSKVVVSGSVGKDVGTYKINYEVVDDYGNKEVVSRTIVIRGIIKNDGVINNGSIYLTFDDGPNDYITGRILDILKDEGVKATFFVTNRGSDYLIKRMHDEGHTVALHTASHDYAYIYSSVDNYFNDLYKVRDRVKRITGIDSKIIRFPGGSSNTISKNYQVGIMTELASRLINDGYRYYDWNVDSMDASTARNSDDVYYNVVNNLYYNRANMVLMHDIKEMTMGALRDIIRFGKNNGYSFNKIDMNTYMIRHGINN